MKDIEDKLAAFLMDYGILKNADADKMAKRIAGMFEKERAQLAAKCAEMEREEARRIRHLNHLATWAQQDPTGPICAGGIQAWVLAEIRAALGGDHNPVGWGPEVFSAESKVSKSSGIDQPLKCDADAERLIVSIGIATLAWAAKKRNGGPVPNNYGIEDKKEWAKDVAAALCHEDEIGNTILQDVLDLAMENAMNRGSCGLRYPRKKNCHE